METEKLFTNSSQVKKIAYADKTLKVTYLNDKVYAYHEVPEEVWQRALTAESIGKFLNSDIKGKFSYTQV